MTLPKSKTKAVKENNMPQSNSDSINSANNTSKEPASTKTSTPNESNTNVKDTPTESNKAEDRLAHLKNLRMLKRDSVLANRSAVNAEYNHNHTDKSKAAKAAALRERAEEELAKMDAEERGEDFERKQAWDWTVAESESWDKVLAERKERESRRGFSDYQSMAHAAYEKELRENSGDSKEKLQRYQKRKMEQVRKHATLMEDEDGNIIAYDKDGALGMAGVGDGLGPTLDQYDHRPDKEDIDNLVNSVKKGDAHRMKKRKKNDGNGELVSYINEKNKQFNDKLSRHYDKVSFQHSFFFTFSY